MHYLLMYFYLILFLFIENLEENRIYLHRLKRKNTPARWALAEKYLLNKVICLNEAANL